MPEDKDKNSKTATQFRAFILQWMNANGIDRAIAAKKLGMGYSTFTNFLNGSRSLAVPKMEVVAQAFKKELPELLIEGRAILGGEERRHEHDTEPPEFTQEQQKAIDAFKICLKIGGGEVQRITRHVLEIAKENQSAVGFGDVTEKRRSA